MLAQLVVAAVFAISISLTIYLLLRRPYLYIRLRNREIRIESYFLGALLGPVLLILFGLLNYKQIAEAMNGSGGLNPIGILVLFLSMVFMSIFLDITGFFAYCARLALKYSRASGRRLFFTIYAIVSILTIFTSNDIIVLTFTPIIYHFTRDSGMDPKPYLIAEFFAANTWSMMLYIGNPTNIVIASAFGIDFNTFTSHMLLPTVAGGVTNALLLYLLFRKDINRSLSKIMQEKPSEAITDMPGAILGVLILSACIVLLSIGPYLNIEMWKVSLFFALALLAILIARDFYASLLRKSKKTVAKVSQRVPWSVVPFILSLFVTVEALRIYGITGEVAEVLNDLFTDISTTSLFYGFASALSANVLNNIPMTVAFVPLIEGEGHWLVAAMATVVGSNIGAEITPLGSLAGIMWLSMLHDRNVEMSFRDFVRYGIAVAPLTLLVTLSLLALTFL